MATNKKLKLSFEIDGLKESAKNIGELEKNLELLNEELKGVDIGSKQFDELSSAISRTTSELRNAELAMEGLDMEQRASEFGSFAAGIADTATGAIALAGSFGLTTKGSEEMVESLVSGMAIAQSFRGGIEGIISMQKLLKTVTTNSAIAQGILNAVMNANPVFLLITGIGLLVGALALFSQSASDAEKKQEMLNEAQTKANEAAAEQLNALDLLSRKLQDNTLSREDQIKAVKDLQEKYPDLLANIDAESASLEEVNQSIRDYNELVLLKAEYDALAELRTESMKNKLQAQTDAQTGQNESWYDGIVAFGSYTAGMGDLVNTQTIANARTKEAVDLAEEEMNVYGDRIAEIEKLISAKEKEMGVDDEALRKKKEAEDAEKQAEKDREARAKERQRQREKELQDRIAAEKKAAEDLEKIQDDYYLRNQSKEDQEVIRRQQQLDKELEMAGTNEALKAQLIEEAERNITAIRQRYADERQAQLDAAREQQMAEEEAFYEEYRNATISQEEAEITAVQDKYFRLIELAKQYNLDTQDLEKQQAEEIKAIKDKAAAEELEGKKAIANASLQVTSSVLGAVGAITEAFAGKSRKQQEKAFKIQKGVQIAQATIDTYKAAMGAFSSFSSIPIVGTILGAVAAAAAVAMGIANIKKIASTKFDAGGGGGGGTPTAPSISAPSATSAPTPPSINLFGQANEGSSLSNAQNEGLRQKEPVVKAVVVESDITNTQNRLSTYQQRSEIG